MTQNEELMQLSVNEVYGQFEGDKEAMYDLLDEFFLQFMQSFENENGAAIKKIQAIHLYLFLSRVIRLMEISFEEIVS